MTEKSSSDHRTRRPYAELREHAGLGEKLSEIADDVRDRTDPSHDTGMSSLDVWNDCQVVMQKCTAAVRQIVSLVPPDEAGNAGALLMHTFSCLGRGIEKADAVPKGDDREDRVKRAIASAFATAHSECHADLVRLGWRFSMPMLADVMLPPNNAKRIGRSWTTQRIAEETAGSLDTNAVLKALQRACVIAGEDVPKKPANQKSVVWTESKLRAIVSSMPDGRASRPVRFAVLALLGSQ